MTLVANVPALPPPVRNGREMPVLVSIITVNFNQPRVTEALIDSVFSTSKYTSIELIVVDNGSDANPIPAWRKRYPMVKFLRSTVNLGFAGGNNFGLAEAEGDYLFLVNNDTEFTPNLVTSMVSYLEKDPSIGIASPKILYYDDPGVIQYAGFTPINFFTCRNACIGQHERDYGQYKNKSGNTGYAHGAAMMLSRTAYEAAGPMPESYFLYYEEMDWCEAIRRGGYQVHVNTKATIYHKESASVGKRTALKEYFMNRNRILFIRRNASTLAAAVFYCYFLAIVVPRNLFQYARRKEQKLINAFLKAVLWNVRHPANSPILGYPIP